MSNKYYSHFYHGNVDMNSNEPYYKIYKSSRNELYTIVCMQWFDEPDYDASRFVKNSDDAIHVFADLLSARDKLNEWYELYEIDSEYRIGSVNNCRD